MGPKSMPGARIENYKTVVEEPLLPKVDPVAADLATLPDEDIERMAASARGQHEKLEAEAKAREAEASTAEATFKRAPSAETLSAKEVSMQLAVNARESASANLAEISPLLQEDNRRVQMKRYKELRGRAIGLMPRLNESADRIAALVTQFNQQVRVELEAINATLIAHNAEAVELQGLERTFGSGDHWPLVRVGHAISAIRTRLALLGDVYGGQSNPLAFAGYYNGGGVQRGGIIGFELKQGAPFHTSIIE